MSDPILGEIRVFPFPWAPRGWALCDGSLVQIRQYQALYALFGTAFGGDGQTTFGLPDLRGRAILGAKTFQGPNTTPGVRGYVSGTERVTLTAAMTPNHSHRVHGTSAEGTVVPMGGAVLASAAFPPTSPGLTAMVYDGAGTTIPKPSVLNAGSVSTVGGGLPHENMQPFLVSNPCVCISGIYPTRP